MSEAAHKVVYLDGPQELAVVENLRPEDVDPDVASDILWLLAAAYSDQWEHKARGRFLLPDETIDMHFHPGSVGNQHAQLDHIRREIDLGKQYWITRDSGWQTGRIVSLAKATPLPPQGANIYDEYEPDYYLNDVLTLPEFQRLGYGIRGVHAAGTEGGFNPQGQMSLDGFIGNMGPNRLFARVMGLKRTKDVKVPPFTLIDHAGLPVGRLKQVRYQTPAELTVSGVMRRLEARKPWLTSAVRIPA